MDSPSLCPAVIEVAAHQLGLLAQPAGAYPQDESPLAEDVKSRYLFGHQKGIALSDQHDARSQLDGAGRA